VRRAALLLAAVALGLAGCPIPQPLPDYPAGTVTPPRIRMDEQLQQWDGAVTLVPANCTTLAPYVLSARVVDTNTFESIEARWFVNYDFRDLAHSQIWDRAVIGPNADTNNLVRAVPPFQYEPYRYDPPYLTTARFDGTTPGSRFPDAGIVRVVELVVSNGFDPGLVNTIAPGVNRTPQAGFETQYHRWVFLTVPESPAVRCP
jgi:hypothetical protein